ncbi:hypothetical protein WICMUC_005558 [Wickerhamomyces mucosus]|uniref:Flavodoxin-like domain-containing protein n=1 Tax=Wickerhamomyces mucosus TaxID=1378264 RepID=A0A9P8P7H6_9ASCO|nr:hypothetical protein WICMUC_005558 [Wickerhamomyces mucosus]
MVKIAIIQYSTYGHITLLSKEILKGIKFNQNSNLHQVDIFQIPETLSDDVLTLINAPVKPNDIPLITLEKLVEYDAFIFGISTRFGTLPTQWSNFWDSTGDLWINGSLHGKPVGLFVSTGTLGGGQEITIRNSLSYLIHHGLIYIPLGYKPVFNELTDLSTVHGGSPWGSGTLAGGDGSRFPNELELKIAFKQGEDFIKRIAKFYSLDKQENEIVKENKIVKENDIIKSKEREIIKSNNEKTKNACCIVMYLANSVISV